MAYLKQFAIACSLGATALVVAGCDSGGSAPKQSMSQVGQELDAQSTAEQQQAKADAERKSQEAEAAAAAQQPAEQPRKEAGRASIGEGGYFTAIAGARRHILNQVDDLAWTQAVQHFQATEGRLPKDHNEFMTKVIEPLGIDLGFKEEGQEFLYDPTPTDEHHWGTLYVVDSQTEGATAK